MYQGICVFAFVKDKCLHATRQFFAATAFIIASCALIPCATADDQTKMTFAAGCERGEKITLGFAGDLLFHKKLQLQAYQKKSSFKRFFTPVKDLLAAPDILYGNLEGPAADGVAIGGRAVRDPGRRLDGKVYSAVFKTLSFNYHPSVIDDLKSVGFDVLSTANNHAMDRGALGAKRTMRNLDLKGMPFTGTRDFDIEGPDRPWHVITSKNNFRVAWLGCTFSTNGLRDRKEQVLFCYKNKDQVIEEIKSLAALDDVDAVILTPHWGVEGNHKPLKRQKALAREAIEAGAAAVIGTHPHVIQPWEKYVAKDGREGLIVYSTGNFISNQRRLMERSGVLAIAELVKTPGSPKARIAAAGFVPSWVVIDNKGHRVTVNSGKGWAKGALAQTTKLLPKSNKLDGTWPPKLPRTCVGDLASVR